MLRWIVRGMGAVTAGLVLVPGVGTLLSPVLRRPRGPDWRPVGPVDRFPVGQVTEGTVVLRQGAGASALAVRSVFVSRRAPGEVVVFSRSCTDLACQVTWDGGSEWFFCPCHGGVFSKEGVPMAGPPPRPLWRFAHRIRDGVLEIDLDSVPPVA